MKSTLGYTCIGLQRDNFSNDSVFCIIYTQRARQEARTFGPRSVIPGLFRPFSLPGGSCSYRWGASTAGFLRTLLGNRINLSTQLGGRPVQGKTRRFGVWIRLPASNWTISVWGGGKVNEHISKDSCLSNPQANMKPHHNRQRQGAIGCPY